MDFQCSIFLSNFEMHKQLWSNKLTDLKRYKKTEMKEMIKRKIQNSKCYHEIRLLSAEKSKILHATKKYSIHLLFPFSTHNGTCIYYIYMKYECLSRHHHIENVTIWSIIHRYSILSHMLQFSWNQQTKTHIHHMHFLRCPNTTDFKDLLELFVTKRKLTLWYTTHCSENV